MGRCGKAGAIGSHNRGKCALAVSFRPGHGLGRERADANQEPHVPRRRLCFKSPRVPARARMAAGIRRLISRRAGLVVPGVYDALGARLAGLAGFEAMFQTGYGTSASMLGMPDYGFAGAGETVSNATRICRAAEAPVIVDADTGYGNALSVWRLVKSLEGAGAAGIFLEDQRWPKRCGHMAGKEVTEYAEYAEKLGAALDARESRDFVIVARTDARATLGLDEAITRARASRKLGADASFVEAPQSRSEMRRVGASVSGPLVANMIEGGRTPILPSSELHDMGFNIVLYPLSALFASAHATLGALRELKRTGATRAASKRMVGFGEFNELVGLGRYQRMERRYARRR